MTSRPVWVLWGSLTALFLTGLMAHRTGGDWRLLFIGELNGHMEPCGCTSPQKGGLARLATFLRGYSQDKRAVAVFNGDMVESTDLQSVIKADTILPYFDSRGYMAINLGENDLALGIERLSAYQASGAKTPLLCGNLTDSSGKRPFQLVAQKTDGDQTLTVIGVLSPHYADAVERSCPGYSLGDAGQALQEAQKLCQSGPAVLLYHGSKEEATAIAGKAAWLKAIVFAHNGDTWSEPFKVGSVWLMDAGQEGKVIGTVVLNGSDKPSMTGLGPEFKDDKEYDTFRDMYLEQLKTQKLLEMAQKADDSGGSKFAGSEVCTDCHEKPHDVWAVSKHAHAFATLVKVKHDYDPECVGCHTIGFAYKSGFSTPAATPKLVNVGCESCHGPGTTHVTDRVAGKENAYSMKTHGEDTCRTCHTIENSPSFQGHFTEYWEKVKH